MNGMRFQRRGVNKAPALLLLLLLLLLLRAPVRHGAERERGISAPKKQPQRERTFRFAYVIQFKALQDRSSTRDAALGPVDECKFYYTRFTIYCVQASDPEPLP
jgi:hypothetical protein